METGLFIGWMVLAFVYLFGWWRAFEKAGRPGWTCIVPVYNILVVLSIAGRPAWWIALLLLPPVNIAVALVMWIDFAAVYGRGLWFALGLWFPPTNPLLMLYLGASDIEYEGL